jgi:hypothetical protein
VPLIGNESSRDRSHLAPAGRAKHPRRRPPSCRRPPRCHSHSAAHRRPPTARPTAAHDDDDLHHLATASARTRRWGRAYFSPPTPAHFRRAVAERLKLTDVATSDLRHFTSCAPKHRRPEPPAIDANRAQAACADGAAITRHKTSIRLTPEPPTGAAHRIKASTQTSDTTNQHDLRCPTRPLDSLPARALMPNSEHCLPGYLCTGLYAVNTSGIMPTQVLSFVSESLPSLAQADDHRAKAVLRAVRHLKC